MDDTRHNNDNASPNGRKIGEGETPDPTKESMIKRTLCAWEDINWFDKIIVIAAIITIVIGIATVVVVIADRYNYYFGPDEIAVMAAPEVRTLTSNGNYTDLMNDFEKYPNDYLEDEHDHDRCFNYGLAAYYTGNWERAISCFERALELKPDNPQDLNNLAAALISRNESADLSRAESLIVSAMSQRNQSASLFNNMGIIKLRRGHTDEARQWFTRALDLDPTLENAKLNLRICDQEQSPS